MSDAGEMVGTGKLAGVRAQGFPAIFALRLCTAFNLDASMATRQVRTFKAVTRRFADRHDSQAIATQLVALAAEKKADPTLDNPIAAWQAEVKRRYPSRKKE